MGNPKSHIEHLELRRKAFGLERRRNLAKTILEKGTPFPREVTYKDIDEEFKRFVEEDLYIAYDGTALPTILLFSNQKIGEYSQSWKHLDETGNILLNFKAVTRDNNPEKGNIYGNLFNIPGNRDYPMFTIPVLQENGQIAYDVYTMKQPFSVDLSYVITIITNKYDLLNEFNELVHDKFKALQCYIRPNGHYMSMILTGVSDESEYNVDDRKFYSQAFNITLRGYIIRKEDFKVTHIPSRVILLTEGDRFSRKNKMRNTEVIVDEVDDPCKVEVIDDRYYYKTIQLNCHMRGCDKSIEFDSDMSFTLSSIELTNVYDFRFFLNDEKIDLSGVDTLDIAVGDTIRILIEKDEVNQDSVFTIIGYDKNTVLDKLHDPESSLDENVGEEIVDIE